MTLRIACGVMLSHPHLIIDHREGTLADESGRSVGEIRHELVGKGFKAVHYVEFFDPNGEYAFGYHEGSWSTDTFDLTVWDAMGHVVGRVDSKKRVWIDGALCGRFEQQRGRLFLRVAWRLCDPSGGTIAELWPDRPLGFFRRSSPWHIEFEASVPTVLRMIAVCAIEPILIDYYASD